MGDQKLSQYLKSEGLEEQWCYKQHGRVVEDFDFREKRQWGRYRWLVSSGLSI